MDSPSLKAHENYGPYKAGQLWGEPDVEQAAHWMKKLVHEPGLAERIGRRASATIEAVSHRRLSAI